jgi:ATP phosphoribosyltransferase-like protein
MESNTQLIANPDALDRPWKRTKLENIALLLKAAIEAQGRVGIMLNVRTRRDLQTASGSAARAAAPTISSLSDDDWVALNTIIEERTVRDLIPRLKARGRGHRRVPAEQDRDVTVPRHHDHSHLDVRHGCGRRCSSRGSRPISRPSSGACDASSRTCGGDGDRALHAYATKFDALSGPLELTRGDIERLAAQTPRAIRDAIKPRRGTSGRGPCAGTEGLDARRRAWRGGRAAGDAARRASGVTCLAGAIRCRRRC